MAGRRYTPVTRCAKIAATQHGVIGAPQAIAAGLSPYAIRRLVAGGSWRRVRPSVFALWIPDHGRRLWLQRLAAAAIWLGDPAAVSHRAAAALRDLDGVTGAPLEFSTTGRRRACESGLIIHRVRLAGGEVETFEGLRVTSVARTLVDLCAVSKRHSVELALESALRERLVTLDQLRTTLDRTARTRKGRATLRSLLDRHPGSRTESELESRVWRILRESGLPSPVRQFEVRSRGRLVARVDFAYPDARIAIEADGYRFHSSTRDWQRERARQNALVRLGWIVYRITWETALTGERRIVEDVSALLVRSPGGEV
jgi:very-short-patch-repair endonuclease